MNKKIYLLLFIIFFDLVFIALHICYSYDFLKNIQFKISHDGGYAERFQYFKFITAGLILLYLAKIKKSGLFLFWSCLAFFLFLDDWLRIHENFGGRILGQYFSAFSRQTYHTGQVIYGLLMALFLGLCFWPLWRRADAQVKKVSVCLFASAAMLWFSAVAVDYIHAMWARGMYDLLGVLLEEGGEHLSASFMLWFCLRAYLSRATAIEHY